MTENHDMHSTRTRANPPGLLTALRSVVPARPLSYDEAIAVAELQANRLLDWFDITDPPVPVEVITDHARIRVVEDDAPGEHVSGSSHWTDGVWLIVLNSSEPPLRRRFSLFHEFKHILDDPFKGYLYPNEHGMTAREKTERVCEHFATCALLPKRLVKRVHGQGLRQPRALAEVFEVALPSLEYRLVELGIAGDPAPEHERHVTGEPADLHVVVGRDIALTLLDAGLRLRLERAPSEKP